MAKDFSADSDTRLDIGSNTSSVTHADFGGDLASDDGVDLNNGEILKADAAKKGFIRGAAVVGAAAAAAVGGFFSGVKQPEYVNESGDRTQINTDLPYKPNEPNLDAARFLEGERIKLNQRQIEAANAASSEFEYSDNCDTPDNEEI